MPNRIIKESICDSEKLAALSDFEFRLWVGLITQADDAGRGDARPAIIKGHVFPFRDRLSIKDIDAALQELAAKGCVSLYKVDGRPYFWFPGWVKHQRVRDCKPKYPGPEDADATPQPGDDIPPQSAASCGELPQAAASRGLNPIQSESNPNPKQKARCARGACVPPSIDEVRAYCAENSYGIDPEAFVDYYQARGWKLKGGTPVKDWQACVRTWVKRRKEESQDDYWAQMARK